MKVGKWRDTVKYLFDTDIISTLMKGKASPSLLKRIASAGRENQAISSITVLEIVYGAHRTANPDKFLLLFEEKVLPAVDVLPFDDNAARVAGRIRAEREALGRPIAPPWTCKSPLLPSPRGGSSLPEIRAISPTSGPWK